MLSLRRVVKVRCPSSDTGTPVSSPAGGTPRRLTKLPPATGGPMAGRIDDYDDPTAPAANSMVPSVNVVVENDAGQLLLIRRSDIDNWAVPAARSTWASQCRRPPSEKPSRRPVSTSRSPASSASTPTRDASSSAPATAKPGKSSRSCSPHASSPANQPPAAKAQRCSESPLTVGRPHHRHLDQATHQPLPRASLNPLLRLI